MPKEEDIYIRALRFAEKEQAFTLWHLMDHLGLDGRERENQTNAFKLQIDRGELFAYTEGYFRPKYNSWDNDRRNAPNPDEFVRDNPGEKVYFSVTDKFRLIEHDELEHARRSSREATCWAAAALLVSIATMIVNIAASF